MARTLGVPTDNPRDEWAAFDLQTPSGIRIEVKSAAYIQSWHQAKLSSIMFNVRRTRAWDAATNILSREARRHAGVYVFALLAHTEKTTIDPLNVNQWRFYVLPTTALDVRTRSQHSITLNSLEKLCGEAVHYAELRQAVKKAAGKAIA